MQHISTSLAALLAALHFVLRVQITSFSVYVFSFFQLPGFPGGSDGKESA